MICPHCGKEIIITLTAPAEDIRRRWSERAGELREIWVKRREMSLSDDRHLEWLSGWQTLLGEIGVTKQEALQLLKEEGKNEI